MRPNPVFSCLIIVFALSFSINGYAAENSNDSFSTVGIVKTIEGEWVRIGATGPIALVFEQDGHVKVDFGNNGSIDVTSRYELNGTNISFVDEEGAMCHEPGVYEIHQDDDYYLAFDLIKDNCGGRIKSTMGYWTRPEFENKIKELALEISEDPRPELFLSRARIYLALGEGVRARSDLDVFIQKIDDDPRAYLNRAATQMPDDLHGVINDCNRTLKLEPDNMNAYFLRGLARYELGEKEEGCADFEKAIQLGFSVLRIAEQEKCAPFWEKDR